MRAAVIGLGRAGIVHAAALSTIPGCEVVGVVDSREASRRNLRGLGFKAAAFDRIEKLLRKVRPEALFVTAPHEERARIARLALEAGVAVQIDRPLAATRAEAEDLARLAAAKGVPLACGHALAFHPVFARAHQALSAGALGPVRQVRSSMYLSRVFSTQQKLDLAPRRSAGGVAAQDASDLLFLLVWFFGAPTRVHATWNRVYGEHEDELHAMMTLPGEAEVGFDCSWSVPGYPRPATVIEMEGDHGKLLASEDALELDVTVPCADFAAGYTRFGHAELPRPARFDLDGDAAYLQDAAFLAWVTGAEPPPARAETALRVPRVLEALYASARQGGQEIGRAHV